MHIFNAVKKSLPLPFTILNKIHMQISQYGFCWQNIHEFYLLILRLTD